MQIFVTSMHRLEHSTYIVLDKKVPNSNGGNYLVPTIKKTFSTAID